MKHNQMVQDSSKNNDNGRVSDMMVNEYAKLSMWCFLIGGTNICAADYILKILVIHYLSIKTNEGIIYGRYRKTNCQI